jgi:hypothetical protein
MPNDILKPIHISVTKTANEKYTLFLNEKMLDFGAALICFETNRYSVQNNADNIERKLNVVLNPFVTY